VISATLAAVHTADWHRPEGSASPDIRRREIPAAVADTPASPRASARMNNISAWMVRCRSPSCLVFNCISVFFGGHSVYLAVILYCPSSNSDREMQHNQPLSKDSPKRLGAWTVLRRGLVRRSHMRSHPRLFAAATGTILVYLLLSGRAETPTRLLLAFDCGALVFLAAVWFMMAEATPEKMRRRAEIEDKDAPPY